MNEVLPSPHGAIIPKVKASFSGFVATNFSTASLAFILRFNKSFSSLVIGRSIRNPLSDV